MKNIVLSESLENYASGLDIICKVTKSEYEISSAPDFAKINILTLEEVRKLEEFNKIQNFNSDSCRWHIILSTSSGGYIICGDRKLDCFHALLKVFDRFGEQMCEYNVSRFKRLYENFDDFYGGFTRAADDFDLELHMVDTVRTGVECFEINTLYDDIPVQVRERKIHNDVYPWWCTYSPGLDMFYESKLFRGVYKEKMLNDNRKVLLKNAKLAKALGLDPVFTTFEPRIVPEKFFEKYPGLRGARVDWDAYSATPEYGLDPVNPKVLEHFQEMFSQLMEDVPDLALFEIWSQDSCASFPWADRSYMKRNGPTRYEDKPFHEIVNPLFIALRDTAKKYNPDTKVNLNLDWVYSLREKEELSVNLPDGVGLSFSFLNLYENNLPYEDKLRSLGDEYVQYIQDCAVHNWKFYGPLVGFPLPRMVYNRLKAVLSKNVHNFTFRGGLCTRVYVPDYINNEVIREIKYNANMDIESFLRKQAERFTTNKEEADILYYVWDMCDKFHDEYMKSRGIPGTNEGLHWTCSLLVSPRTLFRKLVWPIVPDRTILDFSETRYYKPNMFFSYDEDPSWDDMSYFNLKPMTSDKVLKYVSESCSNVLLPLLEDVVAKINMLGDGMCDYLRDLRDRIECFLCIISTEKSLCRTQYLTHLYVNSDDVEEKTEFKKQIREEMLVEIENLKRFIKLLDTSKSVLIPTTSGEETVYMFKTPMTSPLKRKLIVMEKHLDDEPGGYALENNN